MMASVAEGVGAGLGNFLNQVEEQVRTAKAQRDSTVKNLLAIRDKATRLLSDLGHAVMEVPLPRRRGRPRGTAKTAGSAAPQGAKRGPGRPRKTGGISPEGRARIAEAQRARWARLKAAKKSGKG